MTTSLSSAQVTQLLHSWSDGNQAALEKLTSLIYAELHRLMKLSTRTVELEWSLAQAWLLRELSPAAGRARAKSE